MKKINDFIYLIKEKRKVIVLGIVGLLAFSFLITFLILSKDKTIKETIVEEENKELVISKEEKNNDKDEEKKEEVIVEIKGEVKKPGVYTLESSKRVVDAINKAGGLTKNADISVINQSMKLKDEMVIIVYSKEEVLSFVKDKKIDTTKIEMCKDEIKINNDACITNKSLSNNTSSNTPSSDKTNENFSNNKISINNALLNELTTLPGIGEAKAKSIIEYRQKEGLFNDIKDIMKVSGIGEALFEKIKNYITI